MIYGLNGWYWKMPSGRLGVVYDKEEQLAYISAEYETQVAVFLQVDLSLQKELSTYHDSKWSREPKTAPLRPRRYRGKIIEILRSGTPACA